MTAVERNLVEFLSLQEKLLCLMNASVGSRVFDGSDEWTMRPHGAGVCFIRKRDGLCVDVETGLNKPRHLTPWRALLFFESQNIHFEEDTLRSIMAKSSLFKKDGKYFTFIDQ